MASNMGYMPKCIQIRLIKIGLLFLSVAIISVTATILSHNAIDLLFGAVICSVGGIYIVKVCAAVKYEKICVFEGFCVGTKHGDEIGNIAKSVLTGSRDYTLQGDGKTVELISQGSLFLHKGQKYRFYFPSGAFNRAEGKSEIRLYQFYGYEIIF